MTMHPFAHILLASEHTEFDEGAERVAMEMAARCDLPLYAVLPVMSNPEYEAEAPQLALKAEKEASGKILDLKNIAEKRGLELNIIARRGEEPYVEIVSEAKEQQADLIVARQRGKKGFLSNLLIGEMVTKAIGHAPCSVLMVPRGARMWTQGVIAAVDSSPIAAKVVEKAAMIAKICGLPLTIVSVALHESLLDKAQEIVDRHLLLAPGATGMVLVGKAFDRILAAAKTAEADLIVVGRHGDSGVIRSMLGSVAQKVVGFAETPVLVVHPGEL